MKKRSILSAAAWVAAALAGLSCSTLPGPARRSVETVRVMTFNIRMNTPDDGPNAWPARKDIAAGTIAFHDPAIVGLQEVLRDQLADLERSLPGYAWIGVGREDGREAGEYNPIFFRKDRFRLIETSTFWLSETPGRSGVKGWDAACARIVTWARLRDTWTGRVITAFNTHFDHVGERARVESAGLVLEAVRRIAAGGPVVLIGDFNCTRQEAAYRTLVSAAGAAPFLRDARDVSAGPPYGPAFSFNGFQAGPPPATALPIDHIFVGPSIAVVRAGILPGTWSGRFVSDHNPVLADLQLAPR